MSGFSDSETFFINFQSTPRDSFVNFYELMAVLNWFFWNVRRVVEGSLGFFLELLKGSLGFLRILKIHLTCWRGLKSLRAFEAFFGDPSAILSRISSSFPGFFATLLWIISSGIHHQDPLGVMMCSTARWN